MSPNNPQAFIYIQAKLILPLFTEKPIHNFLAKRKIEETAMNKPQQLIGLELDVSVASITGQVEATGC